MIGSRRGGDSGSGPDKERGALLLGVLGAGHCMALGLGRHEDLMIVAALHSACITIRRDDRSMLPGTCTATD